MQNEPDSLPARWGNLCLKLPPISRILLTAMAILCTLFLPLQMWPAWGVVLSIVLFGHACANVSYRYLFRRLLLFLPILGFISLGVPLSQGGNRGMDVAMLIFLRGLVSFLSLLWLIHVLSFDEFLRTLQRYHAPSMLLSLLSICFRYSSLFWEEWQQLKRTLSSRGFGSHSWWKQWRMMSRLLGVLFLRSVDRSEHVHNAMMARNWDGQYRSFSNSSPEEN